MSVWTFFETLLWGALTITPTVGPYDLATNTGKLTITTSDDLTVGDITYMITADNDPDNYINDFFEDYERSYYTEETLSVLTNIIAGTPYSVSFSSQVLAVFTLENIETYVNALKSQDAIGFQNEKNNFKDAFLDPQWNMEISIQWKLIGNILFPANDPKITAYIESL